MQALKHRIATHLHPNIMPNRLKPRRSSRKYSSDESAVGQMCEELEVPQASEVVFRKMWHIRRYSKSIGRNDTIDSPVFRCSVNGLTTTWNMAIRFWKGPNGKKVRNPVVVCLNLTGCDIEETEQGQARIRFQFGVWDANIKHWECCSISNVVLNLQNTQELLSVGYKNLEILSRHIDAAKDVTIMVKIQIVQAEEERHSLSQDLARIFTKTNPEYMDTMVECGPDSEIAVVSKTSEAKEEPHIELNKIHVNSLIIKARSPMLAVMLMPHADENNQYLKFRLDLKEINYGLLVELFRYMYTDKVDSIEALANKLLPLSVKFCMPGLQALCERSLMESITPTNVANILLLADQCKCENLRKAALHYCEDSEAIKENVVVGKNLAWRVMEMFNPDLFLEACESIGSSSSNLDSPSTTGSFSDF
ncbi:uncharacterized protein [Atheta coriaria]|uniref:uncharacterized protein isoform X2 n=1 Tax=Dalotia coriaria TaxID=877792 RepID=UPI0031F41390